MDTHYVLVTASYQTLRAKAKFHYVDFPVTFPLARIPLHRLSRNFGEVGVMEFGLYVALAPRSFAISPTAIRSEKLPQHQPTKTFYTVSFITFKPYR